MNPISIAPFILYISTVLSQSLMQATENRSDLSTFRQLLINNPGPARTLLSETPVAPGDEKTLLLPNNDAFIKYAQQNGQTVQGSSEAILSALLSYHTLNGGLTDEQLNQPSGMTAPSGLLDDTYNHRVLVNETAQPQDGQIVLITQVAGLGQFPARANNPIYAQSGLGNQISVDQASSGWTGGLFHVVDGFLTLPRTCSRTMDAVNLSRLLTWLQRTNLTERLDTSINVTYLSPYNAAFAGINNSYPLDDMLEDLLFHTLPGSIYTTELRDGQIIESLSEGKEVQVTKDENGTFYFNEAKVIAENIVTNNGVMHVLDKMMEPLNATNATTPPTNSTPISSTVPTVIAASSTTVVHGMHIAAFVLLIAWAALY